MAPASWLLLAALFCLPLACAGAQQAPHSGGPSQKLSPLPRLAEVRTVEQASALFDDAERSLATQFLGHQGRAGHPPEPAPPGPSPHDPGGLSTSETHASPAARRLDRCTSACRALRSMKRAAQRLCELAGSDDSRCVNVRERVASAEQLVLSMCPDCNSAPSAGP